MPTYDYRCTECDHTTESFQKITDAPLTTCPQCNKETLQRGPGGGIGLSFKGEGFYITDYTDNGKPKECKKEASGEGSCACKDKDKDK